MQLARITFGRQVVSAGVGVMLAAVTLGMTPAAPAQDIRYGLIDLGTLGGDQSVALDLNDHGMVVGWADTGAPLYQTQAFVWQDGQMTALGTLGGSWSRANAVNNLGQVVGAFEAQGEPCAFHAFNGQMHDLNQFVAPAAESRRGGRGPMRLMEATGINDDGWIVATGLVPESERLHGFVLMPDVTDPGGATYSCVDLGELLAGAGCSPAAISKSGLVVGESGGHAFLWQDGSMQPLDLFTRTVYYESSANAVNAYGAVVGWFADGPSASMQASLWLHGVRFDLRWQPGWATDANDLNGSNQIVGWARDDQGDSLALLWQGREAVDLNRVTAIPVRPPYPTPALFAWSTLLEGTAINDKGQIAGNGASSDGRVHGFILRPIRMQRAAQ